MNLSITGKKYTTPNPMHKMPDLPTNPKTQPMVVTQIKPAMQKQTPVAIKPKLTASKVSPVVTKNKASIKQGLKVQGKTKKQVEKKEQKKEEVKPVEVEPIKQQVVPIIEPKIQQRIGQVTVRYNHYKDKFICKNNVLLFLPIQEKYSFSGVFKGNFIPVLKGFKTSEQVPPQSIGRAVQFSWRVQEGMEYRLQILQDEVEQSKYEKKIYVAPKKEECPLKKNKRVEELTNEMKQMGHNEFGSDHHRELLQQRDLQDVLFS